jgi:hypothetical protein
VLDADVRSIGGIRTAPCSAYAKYSTKHKAMIPIPPQRSRIPEVNSCQFLTLQLHPLLVGRPERVIGPAKGGLYRQLD